MKINSTLINMSDYKDLSGPESYYEYLEHRFGTIESPKVYPVTSINEILQTREAITIQDIIDNNISLKETDSETLPLVEDSFKVDDERIKLKVAEACKQVYAGYPPLDARLRLPEVVRTDLLDRLKRGVLSIQAIHTMTNRTYAHPNREDGKKKFKLRDITPTTVDDRGTDVSYYTFEEGRPANPDLDVMLEHGLIVGPGFYFEEGPNKTGDAIYPCLVKEANGDVKVYILALTRGDTLEPALLGGMVDIEQLQMLKEEPQKAREIYQKYVIGREMQEEMGGDFVGNTEIEFEVVYADRVADMRATATAWPETVGALITKTDFNPMISIKNGGLQGSKEGKAGAMLASLQNIDLMFANHEDIARLGLKAFEKFLGEKLGYPVMIDKEGTLRKVSSGPKLIRV